MKSLTKISLLAVVSLALVCLISGAALASAQISTYDPATGIFKYDFAPEETVLIAGDGFPMLTDVDVVVTRPDGTIVKGDGTFTEGFDTVTTDLNGNLTYEYILDGIEGLYNIECIESSSQVTLATGTFTDNRFKLYGWDNASSGWTPGSIGGYTEGDLVDFRLKITVTSKDVQHGDYVKSFAVWHEYLNSGITGFDSAQNFFIGNESGNPSGTASWVPGTNGVNGDDIEYNGTFTATTAGVFYLYWEGHLAIGSSAWPTGNIHSGTNQPGTHTVPCDTPAQGGTPIPVPHIDGLNPTSGPVGTSVTITGTGFGSTQGGSTVTFNGTAAIVTSWSDTSIIVVVPTGATDGDVVVTTAGGASNGVAFDVTQQTEPDTEDPTGTITINDGDAYANSAAVTLGLSATDNVGVTSMMISNNSAFIGATWDLYATSQAWTLAGPDGLNTVYVKYKDAANNESDPVALDTITLDMEIPTITDETGNAVVPIGDDATITATVTDATSGVSEVNLVYRRTGYYGDRLVTMTRVGSTDTFEGTIPAADIGNDPDVEYNINAYDNAENSNSVGVYYVSEEAPHIDSLNPPSGPVGTPVTISGTGFGSTQGSSTVTFNGTTAVVTSWSDTSILVDVPVGATDGDVVVTTAGGASNGVAFDVTTVSPPAAPLNLTATAGDQLIDLAWNASSTPDVLGYNVYRSNAAGIGRVEERDPRIVFDCDWYTEMKTGYFGGSTKYISTTDSTVDFNFTGTGVRYIAAKTSNRGFAKVYIDDVLQTSVNLYSATGQYQVKVFEATGLSNGAHVMTIEVAGQKDNYSTGYMVDVDACEALNGTWTRYDQTDFAFTWNGDWKTYYSPAYSGGVTKYIDVAGAACTFTFSGNSVTWIAAKAENRGKADVYIDSVKEATVDLYQTPGAGVQQVYTKTGLSLGTHTIRIVNTGTKNALSSGTVIDVDAFDVGIDAQPEVMINTSLVPGTTYRDQPLYNGITYTYRVTAVNAAGESAYSNYASATPLLRTLVRYEQTSGRCAWTGSWINYNSPDYSGGSTKYTGAAGATCIFSFTGTEVTWIAAKVVNRGIANVYIDNVFEQQVDLFDPVQGSARQKVFTKTGLTYGPHTIKVEVTGTKNPGSSNYYVDVDAFDVAE